MKTIFILFLYLLPFGLLAQTDSLDITKATPEPTAYYTLTVGILEVVSLFGVELEAMIGDEWGAEAGVGVGFRGYSFGFNYKR